MTALLYTLGVLAFVVAILVSIGLHELGHLVPAKKFGAKVPQWFVGFGPTVWSKQIGETEYGIKAIPLGGYVKIVGMLPPGAEELVQETTYDADGEAVHRVRRSNTGMFTQLISDARAAEWEYVKEYEADKLFYKLPWWQKVIVMAGGPMVNIAIAFVIFLAIFSTAGIKTQEVLPGQPVIDYVADCVVPAAESGRECTDADPITPARSAGLKPGDRIVSLNGTPIEDWAQFQTMIRANDDGRAVIGLVRDGEEIEVRTNTTVTARPTSAEDATLRQVGFIGVSPATQIVTETSGVRFTLEQMA